MTYPEQITWDSRANQVIEETLAAHVDSKSGRWVPEDAPWSERTLVFRCKCGKYVGSVDRHQDARQREHVASEIYSAIYADHLRKDAR